MIEDIRNRQKHPVLKISSIQLRVGVLSVSVDPMDHRPTIDGQTRIVFDISLENIGSMMARNTCLRLESSALLSWGGYDNLTVRRRGQTSGIAAFWELIDPIYPGMTIGFWVDAMAPLSFGPVSAAELFGGPWLINRKKLADVPLSWSLFADNAPTIQGVVTMQDLGFAKAAGIAVDNHPQKGLIRLTYQMP
jgi:hypothetical protein